MHGSCLIVPPYVLEALGAHAESHVRDSARSSLILTERLRGRRPLEATLARLTTSAPRAQQGEQRRVFTSAHTTHIPGGLVRTEGQPPVADAIADRAYDASGLVYDFYREIYGRDSVDARGQHLVASVHYATHFDNAFWNGLQMVYGDGDGTVFGDFTACIDVIGHELTHGVVQSSCDLTYLDQPGALNESIADVFGSLVKQWHAKQTTDDADWLIGAGLLLPSVHATALRSLAAPGTAYDDPALGGRDPQPAHMRDFVHTAHDDGGVHVNSGIPNHAFYLVAKALGGYAWDVPGRIWYETLVAKLPSDASFTVFATATHRAAKGHGAKAERAVRDAWTQVGIEIAC